MVIYKHTICTDTKTYAPCTCMRPYSLLGRSSGTYVTVSIAQRLRRSKGKRGACWPGGRISYRWPLIGCPFLPTRRGGGAPQESLLQRQLQQIRPSTREADAAHGADVLLFRKDIAPDVVLPVVRARHKPAVRQEVQPPEAATSGPVSYTHLTLPTKRIV